jgi:hypothetical protein
MFKVSRKLKPNSVEKCQANETVILLSPQTHSTPCAITTRSSGRNHSAAFGKRGRASHSPQGGNKMYAVRFEIHTALSMKSFYFLFFRYNAMQLGESQPTFTALNCFSSQKTDNFKLKTKIPERLFLPLSLFVYNI